MEESATRSEPEPPARDEATIAELLAEGRRPLHSFEFFPPKDAEAEAALWSAIEALRPLRPDFVSVTYGASGSSRRETLGATRTLQSDSGLRTMGHLTCASQSRAELVAMIRSYAECGVRHILAVRGDMPGGPTQPWRAHPDGLANATELVELIKEVAPAMTIGVAAFPDVHPQARDADLDVRLLADKQAAGASFAITQMFFDASRYFELVERARSIGCDLPIIAGVQPVTRLTQLTRFAEFSGADLPADLVARLESVPESRVREVGSRAATQLCAELLAGGAPGLHFFTLNRSSATREIWSMLARRRAEWAGRGEWADWDGPALTPGRSATR